LHRSAVEKRRENSGIFWHRDGESVCHQSESGARTSDGCLNVGQHAADDGFFLDRATQRDGQDFCG